MTNEEIILKYKKDNGFPENEPLFTFLEWNKKGYKIKAGEKAHIKIPLWKKVKKIVVEDDKEIDTSFYISKVANLFTLEQVEKKTNN